MTNPSKKPVIGLVTTAEGHLSIAEAIAAALQEKYEVVTYYERSSLFHLYMPMYQLFPQTNRIPFQLSKNPTSQKMTNRLLKSMYGNKMETFFTKHRPELLINTYFAYNPTLEHIAQISNTPLVNIVTDPWTFHPLLISGTAQSNILFDKYSQRTARKINKHATTDTCGWFVRPQFMTKYSQQKVRRELNLDTKQFTVLVTAGSEGTSLIMKILPTLLFTSNPVQVIVACGANKTLAASVRSFKKLLARIGKKPNIQVLSFTKEMHKYMQAADLVVGKAGPNTIFESAATLTPFLAITHISGQEDGNLDLIKYYKLGYVEENLFKAQKLLKSIIDKPQQLAKFDKPIAKLANYNKQTPKNLVEIVDRLLDN